MARILFLSVLVIILVPDLSLQQNIENFISKINETSAATVGPSKSRTLYDYQTRVVAYKDLIDAKCLLEILNGGESQISKWMSNGSKDSISKGFLISNQFLSKRQIWQLAGQRITEFCKGFPTYLIKGVATEGQNSGGVSINDNILNTRRKRQTRHYFQGRVRGQTQSQYLNFGKGDQPGKAEAESTFEGSKAVVSGNNGMGQAQSQSQPFGCDECYGQGYGRGSNGYDQEQNLGYGHATPSQKIPEPIIHRQPIGPGQFGGSPGHNGKNFGSGTEQPEQGGEGRGQTSRGPGQFGGDSGSTNGGGSGQFDGGRGGTSGGPAQFGGDSKPTDDGGPGHTGGDFGSEGGRPDQFGGGHGGSTRHPGQFGGDTRPIGGGGTENTGGNFGSNGGRPGQVNGDHRGTGRGPGQFGGDSGQTGGNTGQFEHGNGQSGGVINGHIGNGHPTIGNGHAGGNGGQISGGIAQTVNGNGHGLEKNGGGSGTTIPAPIGGGGYAPVGGGGQTVVGSDGRGPGTFVGPVEATGGGYAETENIRRPEQGGRPNVPDGGQNGGIVGKHRGQIIDLGESVKKPVQYGGTFGGNLDGNYQSNLGQTGHFYGRFSGQYETIGSPYAGYVKPGYNGHGNVDIQQPHQTSQNGLTGNGFQSGSGGREQHPTIIGDGTGSKLFPPSYHPTLNAPVINGQPSYNGQIPQQSGGNGGLERPHEQGGGQYGVHGTVPSSPNQNKYYPSPTGNGGQGGTDLRRPVYTNQGGLQPVVQGGPGYQQPVEQGGPGYQKPVVQGGPGYQQPLVQGGPGYQQPLVQGGPGYQQPLVQGGPGYQQPLVQGGPGYQQPLVQGGPRYQQPLVQGGPGYQQPLVQGGPGYQQPLVQGGPGYQQPLVQGGPGYQQPLVQGGPGYQQPLVQGGPGYQQPLVQGGPGYQQGTPESQQPLRQPGYTGQNGVGYQGSNGGPQGTGLTPDGRGGYGNQPGVDQNNRYGPNQHGGPSDRAPPQYTDQRYPGITGGGSGSQLTEGTQNFDDSDSQVQTSIHQTENGTKAEAEAQGTYNGGTAQSQVSGVYSGSGSFSASAGSDDGKRGAQTQVSGGDYGARSSAQGKGGLGNSQAEVVLSSQTGDTVSSAQSGGSNHGTQLHVQASEKGGLADAQANGAGSTSSQAQIGFTPYDKSNEDNQTTPFRGGGTAGAQSGSYSGMTQAQIQGKFRYGIKYTGAAQAASGGLTGGKNQTKPGPFKPIPLTFYTAQNEKSETHSQKQATFLQTNKQIKDPPLSSSEDTTESAYNGGDQEVEPDGDQDVVSEADDEEDADDSDDGYDEEDYGKPATRSIITQSSDNQRQHIILDPLEDLDATVHQSRGDFPAAGTILQPGQYIPGSPGYKIPAGFRGTVKSIANGRNTYAIGKNSQAQSVTLSPGSGRIIYKRPVYAVSSNTHSRNGQYGYGSGYTYQPAYQPVQYLLKNGKVLPNFVSVSRSETGSKNLYTGKKTPSIYYTQSSSCGIFTNHCVYNAGKKICFPKVKTNPDGTIMGC